MRFMPGSPSYGYKLLKTGQTTSYGSGTGVDDGALQKGIAKSYTVLTAGQYAGSTNITINSKTDAHANACVLDNNAGLMWSRTVAGSVGPGSDGKLPWTTTGSGGTAEGIWAYLAAANTAALAGYSDWRIPNVIELFNLVNQENGGPPDTTAFPVWPAVTAVPIWTSTTLKGTTVSAWGVRFFDGGLPGTTKTSNMPCALVRGG